jgi:hypothetical protein
MEKIEVKDLIELINKYPNDQQLGTQIRKLVNEIKPK